jgi:hypothetical protein
MWMCMESAPLIARNDPEVARASNDPVHIPVDFVFEIIKSQPGTTLDDLLSLETYEPMHLRIAVARLIESRALTADTSPIEEKKNEIYQARFRKRFPASLLSMGVGTAVAATLFVGVALGVIVRYGGLPLSDPALASTSDSAPVSTAAPRSSGAPAPARGASPSEAPGSQPVPGSEHPATTPPAAEKSPASKIEVKKAYARAAASVRTGPGKEFPSVEFVDAGDELLVVRKEGRWYQLVGDNDDPRWIHDSLVHMAIASLNG